MDAILPDRDRVVSGAHPTIGLLECALQDQAVLCNALRLNAGGDDFDVPPSLAAATPEGQLR